MSLLILFFIWLRGQTTTTFYRAMAAVWVFNGWLWYAAGAARWWCLVCAGFAWANYLAAHEAAAPGWCRQWLVRLGLDTWHGRFDSLASGCLVAAVLSHGYARGAWCLGYLVAAGCRYAARPAPAAAPAAPAPRPLPASQLDVWRAGPAAGVLAGYNAARTSPPTRPL